MNLYTITSDCNGGEYTITTKIAGKHLETIDGQKVLVDGVLIKTNEKILYIESEKISVKDLKNI